MAHALVRRSASVSMAALLVGAAAFWAVTMQFNVLQIDMSAPPPIEATIERVPPAPQPPPKPTVVRSTPEPVVIDSLPTPTPIESAPPTETTLPVVFSPPGLVEITDPHWARTPRELARYYPRRALERGMEGSVRLDCLVNVRGALACAVVEETPPNWGFGQAALRISRDYEMVPAMRGGVPVEGRYRMRVPFAIN